MNYEQLHSFVAFAAHGGNFTHAAKALHISQPALHVQVKKLAESVGRPLYRREGRALVLTPEGERLAAYGREIEERGAHVLAELRGETVHGPVVLAAGQGALLYLLGPAITTFAKRAALRILTLTGPEAIAAVHGARAHLAVVAASEPPVGLESAKLCVVHQRVIVPADHRLANRRQVRAKDLAGESIVVAPSGSPHRLMLAQALSGVDWNVAVEATGWEAMLHFARLGIGIAVVNDFCEPPRGMVGARLDGAPATTYFIVHRAGALSPAARSLADACLA
jgi:LysR family transcriptional regulator, low CO2-responsive transcriptional regulator